MWFLTEIQLIQSLLHIGLRRWQALAPPTLSVGKRFGNSQEKKTFITMPVIAPNMGTYTFILEYMMRLNISIVPVSRHTNGQQL